MPQVAIRSEGTLVPFRADLAPLRQLLRKLAASRAAAMPHLLPPEWEALLDLPPPDRPAALAQVPQLLSLEGLGRIVSACRRAAFTCPRQARDLADLARAVAGHLTLEACGRAQDALLADGVALAWAHAANVARLALLPRRALSSLATAGEHLERGTGDLSVWAEVQSLRASLLWELGKATPARELLAEVILECDPADPAATARAKMQLAANDLESLEPSRAAVHLVDLEERLRAVDEPRLAAIAWLDLILAQTLRAALDVAMDHLEAGLSHLESFPELLPRAGWIGGRLASALRQPHLAAQLLRHGVHHLERRGMLYEAALARLDWIGLHLRQGQTAAVARVAGEGAPSLARSPQLSRAAGLFRHIEHYAHELTPAKLSSLRRALHSLPQRLAERQRPEDLAHG